MASAPYYQTIIRRDNVAQVVARMRELANQYLVVGYPDHRPRQDPGEKRVTNAYLAYVHEFGSPAQNIPARPFIRPGMRRALPEVKERLLAAARAAARGKLHEIDVHLNSAGMVAVSSIKQELRTGAFEPLKPATIANRYRQRMTQSRRASEVRYMKLVRGGMDPGEAQAAAGIRPLINSGQLLNGVTYAIRKVR